MYAARPPALTAGAKAPTLPAMRLRQCFGSCAAAVLLAACADTTAPPESAGQLVGRDSLTASNGLTLPCCAVDSAGAHVTTIAGTLSFYAAAHYTDSVATPAGWMSGACVQLIPDGAVIALNRLVTLPDGSSYLIVGCSSGVYEVAVTRQFDYATGPSRTIRSIVSSGSYTWRRDTLTLAGTGTQFTTLMSGPTITLSAPGQSFHFLAVPTP